MIEKGGFNKFSALYYKGKQICKAYSGKYLVYKWVQSISIQGDTELNTGDRSWYSLLINGKVYDDITITCTNEDAVIYDNYIEYPSAGTYPITLTYHNHHSVSTNVQVYDITMNIE